MTYYHGTNHRVRELTIDPRHAHTRIHLESNSGCVYFTTDIRRARFYANWAVKHFGGEPFIYEVEPTGESFQDLTTIRVPENRQSRYPLKIVGSV
jgi:hypothetical protein